MFLAAGALPPPIALFKGGLSVSDIQRPTSAADTPCAWLPQQLLQLLPGVALSCVVVMAATLVSTLHGGPQFLYALFFGVAFHYLSHDVHSRPGIEFCARTVLRLGVGLLGARITAAQISGLGVVNRRHRDWRSRDQHAVRKRAGAAPGHEPRAIGVVGRLGRHLRRVGGAGDFSGAAAQQKSDRFTLMVVVTVTVLSTVAMVAYPLVARLLHLPPELAGLFLGGTIHDVAQVVGAGDMLNHETGDYATIVHLFRVSMLAVVVVVVVVSAMFKKEREQSADGTPAARQTLVPWFLWVFVALVNLNSLVAVPMTVQQGLGSVCRICLVVVIAALGIKTSFRQLARAGWKPFILLLVNPVDGRIRVARDLSEALVPPLPCCS